MTNQQQHGMVWKLFTKKKKKGISNDQTFVSNNSNHKANTTWESGSKYLNDNYIYKMPFIYIFIVMVWCPTNSDRASPIPHMLTVHGGFPRIPVLHFTKHLICISLP